MGALVDSEGIKEGGGNKRHERKGKEKIKERNK
jgi:hypothetical protein